VIHVALSLLKMTLNSYKLNAITCLCTGGNTNKRKKGAGALGITPNQCIPPSAANAHCRLSLSVTLVCLKCPSPQLLLIIGTSPSDSSILFCIYEAYL
jgi:hypothetical protein